MTPNNYMNYAEDGASWVPACLPACLPSLEEWEGEKHACTCDERERERECNIILFYDVIVCVLTCLRRLNLNGCCYHTTVHCTVLYLNYLTQFT